MTRSILTLAAALFAATTFLAPAAKACISCEYTPPVVNTPVHSFHAKHYRKRRVHRAAKIRRARAAKRRMLEAKARARARARAEARAEAKAKAQAKAIKAAEAKPVELDVNSENSSVSSVSIDKSETAEAKATPVKDSEVSANIGCKKFFPSVGMTLTVPCE